MLQLLSSPPQAHTVQAPPHRSAAHTQSPHLLDLLALLGGATRTVDVKALLVHGHARLALAPLDLGQPRLLLLLPHLQLLQHALVVALHLLPLLWGGMAAGVTRRQRLPHSTREPGTCRALNAQESKAAIILFLPLIFKVTTESVTFC